MAFYDNLMVFNDNCAEGGHLGGSLVIFYGLLIIFYGILMTLCGILYDILLQFDGILWNLVTVYGN